MSQPQDLPRLIERSETEAVSHESVFNLIHQESVIKVDCIVRKSWFIREFREAA